MLTDSHCHLDRIDLKPYHNDFSIFIQETEANLIEHMLCIAIDLESFPAMCDLVSDYQKISLTVGVHPNVTEGKDPDVDELVNMGMDPRIVGIGETGLDYFRSEGDLTWQQDRFRNHIRAAKILKKPLVIHSRNAKEDTLKILEEEGAGETGGVIHCFTEDWDMARRALDLNFYISFSGIVTFNSAKEIQDVARKIPPDRFLIETDSPYLAPVPFRGKPNYPIYVRYIAEQLADLRCVSIQKIAEQSTDNYYKLFHGG